MTEERCDLSELLVEHCAHCISGSRTLGEQRPAWDDEVFES